ncbi:MAG: VOC family protein [Chryseolinea sp.]
MNQRIAHIALVVRDYDEAIEFYTKKIGFILVEDTRLTDEKRWVLISPKGNAGTCLLLAKATDERQIDSIGNQTGGRVFLFLFTDDISRDYHTMMGSHVHFTKTPKQEPYGTVAVFQDLYGNLWDLIQPHDKNVSKRV